MPLSAKLQPAAPERCWYVLQCKPKQTLRALEHLERQGYECFLPMHTVEKLISGKALRVTEPLFGNYLFIHLCMTHDNWMPLRSTRGVSKFVRFGQYPLQVRPSIIDSIRTRQTPPTLAFNKGDKVRITDGSFAELEAIFLAHDSDERAILLITLLHRDNVMQVPLGSLRKL